MAGVIKLAFTTVLEIRIVHVAQGIHHLGSRALQLITAQRTMVLATNNVHMMAQVALIARVTLDIHHLAHRAYL